MTISRVSIYRVELPYVHGTYQWSGGTVTVADSTVVRIDTDDGLSGWGESCPIPCYLPAHAEGVRAGIGMLAPHLLGMDPSRVGLINDSLDHQLIGHRYVKSALDVACYDILGQSAGLPVYTLLGGRQLEAMPMCRAIPRAPPDEMACAMGQFRREGYRQFQLKVAGKVLWRDETWGGAAA